MARLSMYPPAPRTHARAEAVYSIIGSPPLHHRQAPEEDVEMAEDWDEDQTLVHLANAASDDSEDPEDTNIDDLLADLADTVAAAEASGLARTSGHLLPATRAARAAHADLAARVDRHLAIGVTGMRTTLVEAGKRVGAERPDVDVAAGNKRDKELFAELQSRYRMRGELQQRKAALVEEKVAQIRLVANGLPAALDALANKVNTKAREFDKADALAADQQRRMLQGLMAQV
ncbi:hypothetical protein PENSPDRAFT_659215 [Peniophora sp. CONT]|nr:hypothetical protein PENSPDRAFT_659215 [Peniophora sp. CONT]